LGELRRRARQVRLVKASPLNSRRPVREVKKRSLLLGTRLMSIKMKLDTHLTELVSDRVDCGEFGNIEAGPFMVSEEDYDTMNSMKRLWRPRQTARAEIRQYQEVAGQRRVGGFSPQSVPNHCTVNIRVNTTIRVSLQW
jgi:hypothetical protein